MEAPLLTKQQIIHTLDELSPESLSEVQQFLDFLRFKNRAPVAKSPATLGGLLADCRFTPELIAQARWEMWEADEAP